MPETRKALAGEIENFTGVSDPYEEPENPEIILETDKEAPKESIDNVIEKLKELGLIPKKDEEKIRRKDKEKTKERLKSLGYM